ncbi:MAG: glucose-1-phosphate adenylyltransferase subunit GlgD [Clostridiales bacterium]|nr:MAG: glucose-1-phosphate adenylyltransferase subunit GlgD [Clostridiales bacterium]
MTQDVIGIINLAENEEKIQDLTANRPIAAIPFGGRYRVVDFTISNMVNSGIRKVAIFTKSKFRSLQDHLGPGKYWNLDRKRDGLYMLHPMTDYTNSVKLYGDLQTFKDNLDFLVSSRQKYVLICRSYVLANIDLKPIVEFHKKSKADITIIGKPIENGQAASQYIGLDRLELDDCGNVTGVGLNFGSQDDFKLSLEMYLLKKELLIEIITEAYSMGKNSFLKQAVFDYMNKLKVNMYPYQGPTYFINSIFNYYKASMDLLHRETFKALFDGYGRIYTKIKDEPSTMYGSTSCVTNSIVANGCRIEGTVENSIVFRGVHVAKGAIVRNSIIMQNTEIDQTAHLNYVITDKGVKIAEKKILMGDGGVPFVIKKGVHIK